MVTRSETWHVRFSSPDPHKVSDKKEPDYAVCSELDSRVKRLQPWNWRVRADLGGIIQESAY